MFFNTAPAFVDRVIPQAGRLHTDYIFMQGHDCAHLVLLQAGLTQAFQGFPFV